VTPGRADVDAPAGQKAPEDLGFRYQVVRRESAAAVVVKDGQAAARAIDETVRDLVPVRESTDNPCRIA
jgi:hypothetical protein